MSAIGGQNLRPTGRAVRVETYPAELRTLIANARSALGALHDGIDTVTTLDSIQLDYVAVDVDRLYPTLDHVAARVHAAQMDRLTAEHNVVADVARALMRPVDPS